MTAAATEPAWPLAGDERRSTEEPTPIPINVDAIWERPSLQHLRDYARARQTSPWAVLGVALVRVVVATKPFVQVPPIVGSAGSLNLFIALVGPSGSGKGAATGVAEEAVDVGEITTRTVGSGEGIPHVFAHRDRKRDVIRDEDAVLINIPEVDTLTALGSRQGSTLLPVLRSAWSGEALGFANADPNKTIPIPRHSYRLGVVLGVQPARAGALLDDSDGGTPQRFLWLPATDPDGLRNPPPPPPPRTLARHAWPGDTRGRHFIHVPADALEHIREVAYQRNRGTGDPLDGHAAQTQLKTAQALAVLDDRQEMTEEDWHFAGLIMQVSDRTRADVRRQLGAAMAAANTTKGYSEGIRAAVADDTRYELAVRRVCQNLTRRLAGDGDMASSDLRKALASRDREYFEDAVERLLAAGQLQQRDTAHGTRLAATGSSSA